MSDATTTTNDKPDGVLGYLTAGLSKLTEPVTGAVEHWRIKHQVPELFEDLADAPDHTQAVVIGSGFGAAVTACRLAQAGVEVTVLERGSRWPTSYKRQIHSGDVVPDGRAMWHQRQLSQYTANALSIVKVPYLGSEFGGMLDSTRYGNMEVLAGACVGGGSKVYTGVSLEPSRENFDRVWGSTLPYEDMHRTWYPMARRMLQVSPMPEDIYQEYPEMHRHRVWDKVMRNTGWDVTRTDSIFNWDVIRDEHSGKSRRSALAGESNFGNSNAAKRDVTQTYLKYAEDTGRATVFPGHEVQTISQRPDGVFEIQVRKLDPTGEVLAERTITADNLFLGAGSAGTSQLLARAQAQGTLANLNEHIGRHWGGNGDAFVLHGLAVGEGPARSTASPNSSLVTLPDAGGLPLGLEGWYIPGIPFDPTAVISLAMAIDTDHYGTWTSDSDGRVSLDWPDAGNDAIRESCKAAQERVLDSCSGMLNLPDDDLTLIINEFTAHPLGGAVLGKATDDYGNVHGHPGLYVVDGALVPGSTGAVNPSLTITALAERCIAEVIRSGGLAG